MSHRAVWLSDIHLNFVDSVALTRFAETIDRERADSVLISGDIAQATSLSEYLTFLDRNISAPIYFVLGNHDFYRGSVRGVRKAVSSITANSSRLTYLSNAGLIRLTEKTALIGHDGWADGCLGNFVGSEVILNDYVLIEDFASKTPQEGDLPLLPKADRLSIMQSLAAQAADHFARYLPEALELCEYVVVVTHVPPFREACWYDGKVSNPDYLPHFSCKAVGDVLLEVMGKHPHKQMTVLCGHTHGEGEKLIRPNLRVLTAGALYTEPEIQRILDIE